MAIRNTFKSYERLKREQHIDTLFRNGKAFSVLQIRFVYQLVPRGAELSPVRAGFAVPKKKHRKSVDRHKIRRQMIEAWRMNKQAIYQAIPTELQLHLFVIYSNTEKMSFDNLQAALQQGIAKLLPSIERHDT